MGETEYAVERDGPEGPRLGPRAWRRGTPRVGTTAAAAGAFVAFSGAMTLAFDATPSDDGGTSNVPGTLISLAVLIAGYALLAVQKRGPLATAGLVAFAIALPFFAGFATLSDTDFPPISINAILGLSTTGWAVAYAVGPSRGHPFLLGAALLGAWWFLLEQVTEVFSAPFDYIASLMFAFGPQDEIFAGGDPGEFGGPDPTEIMVVCGVVAVAYFVLSHRLERRGAYGVATPMVAIGHVAAIVAVLSATDDLEEVGTGILAVLVGLVLLYRGASAERRATTWLGGAYVAAGLQSVVSGLVDSPTSGGVLLIGLGLVVVVLAAYFAQVTDEPDDDEPGASFPEGLRRRPALVGAEGEPPPAPEPGPPGEGWWRASDDNWYPPEQHPDA